MSIAEDRQARDMDLKKSMLMGLDECHLALRESYVNLTDGQFWRCPLSDHNNIVTIVMHCLQQHDDFNGNLQVKRNVKGKYKEWHFLKHEERFNLWQLPAEQLPKSTDTFPTVEQVRLHHEEIHGHLVENINELPEDDFISNSVGPWPRLCDIFFRATYHTNAHIRQIWLLQGLMDITTTWPKQYYA